ncbi:MAG: hypothetical protein R6W76_21795 [Caldilinea sp.]
MKTQKSWKQWLTAGVLIGALVLTAFAILPQTTFAQTNDSAGGDAATPTIPWGRGGMMAGMKGFGEMRGQYHTFLAEALDITVEELQAAQQKAQQAMVDQAVEDGTITQEQADLMNAGRAFMQYYTGENAQTLEDALNAAVAAGAITQEQANLLLEARGQMRRGMFGDSIRGQGGRGDFHHRGMMPGFDGQMPGRGGRMMPGYQAPTETPEANS